MLDEAEKIFLYTAHAERNKRLNKKEAKNQ